MSGSVTSLGSSQISSEIAQVQARLQKPITLLQNQEATDKAEISAWGSIQGDVSTLSTSLAGISDLTTINNRAATTTVSTVATATATNSAAVGQYNLTNVTLAKLQEIYSAVKTSASSSLGSAGSLTISLKGGKTETVAVAAGDVTLNGISQAINAVAGGVKASVVNTSGGARLVLQGSATGSSQAFSVAGTGGLAEFDYSSSTGSGAMTLAQAASNATLKINGVPVSNSTNSFSSAITGVAITVAGSGATSLSVSSSPGTLAGAVSTVATNLNAAIAAIAKQIAYVPASSASGTTTAAQSGPLLGNFTATDLTNQLLTGVTSAVASGITSNAVGLTVSTNGAVSFDSATFSAEYAKNPTGVQALVAQIYSTLNATTTSALGVTGTPGTIADQTTALQTTDTSIESQIAQITASNNEELQILLQQYTVAESAATAAQTTQAYLSIFTSIDSGSSTQGKG